MRAVLSVFFCLGLSAQVPPADKESALGAQLARQMQQTTTALDNPVIAGYVAQIGGKFAGGRNCTFAVVTDSLGGRTHEPAAYPGCFVFVSTGLLLAAGDEGEFTGMLAHALSHHAAQGQTLNPNGIPLVFLGGWNGDQEMAVPGSFRKLQRARELDADHSAVVAMADAGYDPRAFVRYVTHMQPTDGERIAALDQAIAGLPVRTYTSSGDEFDRIRKLVRELTGATGPVSRRVPPSLFVR
jgi:predicted Zn-dependent protease